MSEKRILKPEMEESIDTLLDTITSACLDHAEVENNEGVDDFSVTFDNKLADILSAEITEALEEMGLDLYQLPKVQHELKCWPIYFSETWDLKKPFEIRKNDRNFKVGDLVLLREYEFQFQKYTNRSILAEIMYILRDMFLEPGFVVFTTKILKKMGSKHHE
jgi:hypothetical protein